MSNTTNKGMLLAFLTAIVSGFSIFINSIAVSGMNAFWFTSMKNILVALALVGLMLALKEFNKLKELTRKQWLKLIGIGLTGGSFAFLLFFYALKMSNAVNAGFIHKTLFIWVTLLAAFFLKEKVNKHFLIGAMLLLAGNYFIFSNISMPNAYDGLIFIAVILWAIENVIAKTALYELSGTIVAFGRMFLGSIVMLAFLFLTGNTINVFSLSTENIFWIMLTAILLFFYVVFWYNGLKLIEAHKATAILSFGQIITAMLTVLFAGKTLNFNEAIGLMFILAGLLVIIGFSFIASKTRWLNLNVFKIRN